MISVCFSRYAISSGVCVAAGNSPWIALVGGVRRALCLGWWCHRWGVIGGQTCGCWVDGSRGGGGCLRGEVGRRWSGGGLGLQLGLLSLLRLLRLK